MKKLSCFALVVALVLAAGAAFASSPLNVTHEQAATVTDMDTFIISGEPYDIDGYKSGAAYSTVDGTYVDYDAAGDPENDATPPQLGQSYLLWNAANLHRNKWLVDKKAGFSLYVQKTVSGVAVNFDLVARSGLVSSKTSGTFVWENSSWTALTNKWQNKVMGATGIPQISGNAVDGFQGFLVRTAADVSEYDPMLMPFNLTYVRSGDLTDDSAKRFVRTVMSGDMVVDRAALCAIDCCAVTFELDCCDEMFTSADSDGEQKGYVQNLKIWFNEPNRYGVYCCQDFGIWVTNADRSDENPGNAVFSPDFATAHLNDENMVRVRVAPNDRPTWYSYLNDGKYSDNSVSKHFWPVEKDLTNTYSRRTDMQDCGLRYDWVQFYAAATSIAAKNLDLIDVADNYFGQMQYLGVWYNGNATTCECSAGACSADQTLFVPRVTIQNLGVDALDIKTSQGAIRDGVCSEDCGLCDTVMASPDSYKLNGLYSGAPITNSTETGYLGDIFVDRAYRWGDFNYKNNHAVPETDGDIIQDQCSCWIYPAFTKTIQPKANMNFKFMTVDGTGVTGRWNTMYTLCRLSSTNADPCCVGDLLYVFQACECGEQTNVREALTTADCTTTGLRFPTCSYMTLDTGIVVTNNTWDLQRIAQVVSLDDDALWYDYFKIKDTKYDSTKPTPAISGVQLRFTVDSADFAEAGYDPDAKTWRADFWDKFTVIAVVNGQTVDLASVMTKADFDWQGSLFAKVDEVVNSAAGQSERKENTEIMVYLPIFAINGELCGAPVKYIEVPATKNKMIVVNDGVLDGYFKGVFYIAKKGTVPCTITLSDASVLVGATKTITATVADTCSCSDVVWGTVSSDKIQVVSSDAKSIIVKGLKVGTENITAKLECDETVTATAKVTVTTVTPTSTPTTAPSSSSSGGCNAGAFAPFALVLLAPIALLLKK